MIRLEQDQLDVWCEGLCDLTLAELKFALGKFNRETSEFPTIAAVRRFAGPKGMTDEQRAAHVWDIVTATVRSHGAYQSIDFSDRIANAVIRSYGGWERFCGEPSDQLTWVRKRFLESYVACARTGNGDASPLPGIAERENGFAREKPVAIDCRLPVHAIHKRLTVKPSIDLRLPAPEGPVSQLADVFRETMRKAIEDKAARQAAAAAENDRRIQESQAAKDRQMDALRGLMAQQRDEFITRVKAKRERKRKSKVTP